MFGFNFFRKSKQQIISINEFGRIFDTFYKNDSEKFLNELYDNPFTSSAIVRINEAINNLVWSTYKKGLFRSILHNIWRIINNEK